MNDTENNLVLEHLRHIRAGIEALRDDVLELKNGQIRTRNDIHELRGDVLRLETAQADISVKLQRIEKRIGLIDA